MNKNGSSVMWMKGVEQESHGVEKRERWWRSNCVMRRHENPFLAGDLVLVLVLEPPTHTSFSAPHKIHYPTPICNLESMDKTAVAHPSSLRILWPCWLACSPTHSKPRCQSPRDVPATSVSFSFLVLRACLLADSRTSELRGGACCAPS